jgi:hypothetical protein
MKFLIYFMTIYIKMLGNNTTNNNKKGVMASVYPTTKPIYSTAYVNKFIQNPIGNPGLTGGWMNIKSAFSPKNTKSA